MRNYEKKKNYKCHGKYCSVHHKPYIKYSYDHIYNINHEGKIHYVGKPLKYKSCCNYKPHKYIKKVFCNQYCKNGYYYPRYINEYYPNYYYHDKYCSYDYYHKCINLPCNNYYHEYYYYPEYGKYRNSIFNSYGNKYNHPYY